MTPPPLSSEDNALSLVCSSVMSVRQSVPLRRGILIDLLLVCSSEATDGHTWWGTFIRLYPAARGRTSVQRHPVEVLHSFDAHFK